MRRGKQGASYAGTGHIVAEATVGTALETSKKSVLLVSQVDDSRADSSGFQVRSGAFLSQCRLVLRPTVEAN